MNFHGPQFVKPTLAAGFIAGDDLRQFVEFIMESNFRSFNLSFRASSRATTRTDSVWRSVSSEFTAPHGTASSRTTESYVASLNRGASFLRQPPRNRDSYTEGERAAAAAMMLKLKRGEDVRIDKVENLRDLLSTEDYENDLKLDVAVERLLDDLRLNDSRLIK